MRVKRNNNVTPLVEWLTI